jgi:phage gpG-like protein
MKPEQTAQLISKMIKSIKEARNTEVVVGLPKGEATSKVYDSGSTVLEIGLAHEYGASINHPGGTPYKIIGNGKSIFLKKGSKDATGITKPHKINIPQRSFMRTPFIKKKDDMPTFTLKEFRAVMEGKRDVQTALGRIGLTAENMIKESFRNNGYGTWKPLKSSTKRSKGSSKPLIDTGTLRNSIISVVRKKQ